MMNPIQKAKGHKYASQTSLRENSQSPDLFFPGNMSVLKPPPGLEHIIPVQHLEPEPK